MVARYWPTRQYDRVSNSVNPLPTGIVTFLLTDIEGSTQAWQASPDSMTALVSRHYEILETGVAAHRGRRPEEQGEGDSVVAVFEDVADAVAAALDTQCSLQRELPDLPVRMAIHTGEAMLRNENNYVGLTIIRCARIRACGYGGQILVSEAAAHAVESRLPQDAGVLDLGAYGLRGLDGRQRIWQLTHPHLRAEFPPLKAGTSAAGNLPTPIGSFVGRRSEVAAISHSLAAHRLVSVTGEAGLGKSRIAIAAAGAAANSMPGGVWWVALGDLTDDLRDEVAAAIVRACSLDREGGDDPIDLVIDQFNSIADALLVIDAAEQAPRAVAQVVDQVLTRCPHLRVLSASRRPMGIPGEVVHVLDAMTVPPTGFDGGLAELDRFDSARLFLERAASVDSASTFTDADAAHVARICRDLDGVPLGLELAAARIGAAPIAELAASLDAIGSGADGRTAVGMIDTLSSSIAWSYQFLTDHQQHALRCLSVFRGAFEIDAAAEVVAGNQLDERTAATSINALIDQHLLVVDANLGRIVMPPAIHRFADERLAGTADAVGATARHASWFAGVAERFGMGGPAMSGSLLDPDMPDLIGALESSMGSSDPSPAYRILIGLGAWLHLLDHDELVQSAARWIASRSPSDGEERWAAAVARLSYALSADPRAAINAYGDEAQAIAEMVGDVQSALYLGYGPAARAVLGGDLGPAEALAAAARQESVDEVTLAIERHVAAAHRRTGDHERAAAVEAELAVLLGDGSYRGPIDTDRSGTGAVPTTVGSVADDMAMPT